ncbi:hypothetical protein Q5692_17880 [Microcoleus sp. C2C3]|uniref:hypothetical protein n=1 Tax=unclassified Microcoleus TaxID=2642155 RepID=UPI002FCFFE39
MSKVLPEALDRHRNKVKKNFLRSLRAHSSRVENLEFTKNLKFTCNLCLNIYRNRVNKLINAIVYHAKDATKQLASVVMRTSHI